MESPMCKMCGKRHWSTEACLANGVANTGKPVTRKEALAISMQTLKQAESERKPKVTYKYRDPEKRKAYQRELMRKRRAGKCK